MPVRYKCPVCGVQLTLNSPPEPRFECPKCERKVTLVSIESPPPPQPAPKPPSNKSTAAPARTPPQRQAAPDAKPRPRGATAADAFDLPLQPPPPSQFTSPAIQTPVPCEPSLQTPWDNPRFRVRATIGGVVVLFCILLIAIYALNKPRLGLEQNNKLPPESAESNAVQARDTAPNPQPTSSTHDRHPNPSPGPTPSDRLPSTTELPKKTDTPKISPPAVYDHYGNQVGDDIGLGQQHEFKGKRLLFWGGHTVLSKVYFSPSNPLWKAFEVKGFTVHREFGAFKTDWLNNTDQLWILSTSTIDAHATVPPELLEEVLKQELARNPSDKRPFGWSDKNFLLAERTELELGLSPKYPLNDEAFVAIEKFINSGKGVCLLAGDDQYIHEANELATRLYGASVNGNYPGQKIAYVRQRELSAETIHKFNGAYAVDDHQLLTGVNFLYEGITISNVGISEKLEVAMKASDGKPLLAVSKVPGQRVVIDCGYTRYCHGPNEETSFILKTAGTVRLAQNIAAHLAGKVEVKKP